MEKYHNNQVRVYNSLTGEKELFEPLNAPNVGMYVCGPTVYNNVHLGNCRTFLSFDMVVRYLRFLDYKVRYVRNITDAGHLENDADEGEDKIAKKARLEQLEPMEIVQTYTEDFRAVMSMFNAVPPSIEPTATGHIVEQIDWVQNILDKGMAYESNGSVYFDVLAYQEKKGDYGILSGRNIEELMAGSRELDGQDEKKNSFDFALWKKASPMHIMRWSSPWGEGFPGWHLECSVMGTKYLGEVFDIHGGGMDLKFPHHECEIAQGVAANDCAPVKYWMHANMLTLNGKRMSKSSGNFLLPTELFSGENNLLSKGFSPMVVRFFMLQAHYRSTLDFSSSALEAAEKGFQKLMSAIDLLKKSEASNDANKVDPVECKEVQSLCQECYVHMNDDFNTSKTIAVLFDLVSRINKYSSNQEWCKLDHSSLSLLKETFNGFIFEVFGLQEPKEASEDKLGDLVEMLVEIRSEAKNAKNYALSDSIRDRLGELGILLKDSKEGTTYSINK